MLIPDKHGANDIDPAAMAYNNAAYAAASMDSHAKKARETLDRQ